MFSRHCAYCWDWPCQCSAEAKRKRVEEDAAAERRIALWRASTTPAQQAAEYQRTIVIPRHLLDD